jgi:hypothetical protein
MFWLCVATSGRGVGWAEKAKEGLRIALGLPKVLRFWIVDINSFVPRNALSRRSGIDLRI